MPFHLYHGNDLSRLSALLAARLRGASDPFFQDLVVAPDRDLFHWLTWQIAARNGFCPALTFKFPGKFLYDYVFTPFGEARGYLPPRTVPTDDAPFDDGFSPAAVTWRLWRLLPELAAQDADFARVKNFLADDALRVYQLSVRLAALFDRYMTYRADLLERWENGVLPTAPAQADERWQAKLWRALLKIDGKKIRHFSGLYREVLRALASPGPRPWLEKLRRQRRVFYFGISSLPPAHLDVLRAVAATAEIYFFAFNPCAEFWDDAQSRRARLRDEQKLAATVGEDALSHFAGDGNPLLGSLGRLGQEMFGYFLAHDLAPMPDEAFIDFTTDFTGATALTNLRRAVQFNQPAVAESADGDDSITVHSCHSAWREVEVLRDQILARFAADQTLTPADIRVYAPAIADYAPYIAAVFGRRDQAGYIPFTIGGVADSDEANAEQTFLSLLSAATGRFHASEILDLLRRAPVARRFNFSAADLELLPPLLRQAGLAWGLDADARDRVGAGAVYANTWRFALDRLLLGAAMFDPTGDAQPLAIKEKGDAGKDAVFPVIPVSLFPNTSSLSLVGNLATFIETLAKWRGQIGAAPQSAAAWQRILTAGIDYFFPPDAGGALRDTLDRWSRCARDAGAIPFAVVQTWLREQFSAPPDGGQFTYGKMLFAGFSPARATPARVVCLLGMNDGALPRPSTELSFDLMDARFHRRVGDRPARDEDRYAFLETLLAAREHLVVVYTGQSAQDNQPLPPAVLVSELLDALPAAEKLTVKHPLQPFSPTYFRADKDRRLAAFSAENFAAAKQLQSLELKVESLDNPLHSPLSTISTLNSRYSLESLFDFLRSPTRYFYRRTVGARWEVDAEDAPNDEEPLEILAGLERYRFDETVLNYFLKNSAAPAACDTIDVEKLWRRLQASGELPLNARRLFAETTAQIRRMLARVADLNLGAPAARATREIRLPNGTLTFTPPNLCANGQLFLRPTAEKGKDALRAGLYHLALGASGVEVATHGVYFASGKISTGTYLPLSATAAQEFLAKLLDLFNDYHARPRPLCFEVESGWKLFTAGALTGEAPNELTRQKWETARRQWENDGTFGAAIDAYTTRIFGAEFPAPASPEFAQMHRLAATVFAGIGATREQLTINN
ncbi:RecBCD enzyme subunit RecC [Planctomycetales bacterium]|nr:RecBCD enzyme subunit RecC [Planctomycetales bacterium]GHT02299.1 RecBCD enzyme subunit RecC [Planctomycetales bacterium]